MQAKVMVTVAAVAMSAMMAWANCGACPGDKPTTNQVGACCKAGDTAYVCQACNAAMPAAGKCAKCNAEMKAMHVLAMKDGKVSLCPCEAGCKCTIKADDPKQCGCGKAVVTLDCAKACPAAPKTEAQPSAKPKVKEAPADK